MNVKKIGYSATVTVNSPTKYENKKLSFWAEAEVEEGDDEEDEAEGLIAYVEGTLERTEQRTRRELNERTRR